MRGHVRKRGSKWCFVVTVGVTGEGVRRQKWHSGFATRKDAEAALARALTELREGTYVEPARQSVREYLAAWLDAIGGTVRPGTLRSYRTNIDRHVVPRVGALRLAGLTPVRLNAMYSELLASGRHDGRGGLSPRTVQLTHVILHRAFRDAVRWGFLARNPADLADPPRQVRPELKVWSAEELRAFLAHAADDDLRPLWMVLATTGMRRGEALGLRWQDVDLDAGRVAIRQTLGSYGGKLVASPPKTPKSRRGLTLDDVTVGALHSHRIAQAEEALAAGKRVDGSWLVFARPDGSPLRPDSVSRRFIALTNAAGLPRIRVHDLRHTYATIALAAGTHPKVVAERLGHATIAITLDTYSHVLPSLEHDEALRIAQLIVGGPPATTGQ